jgi:MFS family permease
MSVVHPSSLILHPSSLLMTTKLAAAPETPVEREPKPGPLDRLFRAFTYRDFRLLWFGAFTSSSGTWLQETALSWLILQLVAAANQELFLGLNSFLATAPILLFSLIGGVVADRVDRRRILLTSQYLQLSFAFVLAALAAFDVISIWPILLLSFLTGCAQAFGGPAYQALVPMLVERRDLSNAIALNSIQFNLARAVGPAIGGTVLAAYGAALCFGLNGLSFVAVIIALSALGIRHIPRTATGKLRNELRGELRGGLAFVGHQEALRSLTLLAFASAFSATQLIVFLPVFAKNIFHMGVGGYSSLLSTSGAGAVVGALLVAWLGDLAHKGRTALLMQMLLGAVIVVFALSPLVWLAYPLVFLGGVFMMAVFALISSLVQLLVSDEMRGRVMSIYMVAFRGAMPLGGLIAGFLAKRFSLAQVLAVEGALLSLIAAGYLLSHSKVKEH